MNDMLGYMKEPCAKCGKMKAVAIDSYHNKQGNFIVKYICENCKHYGKRSSRIRKNKQRDD